MPPDALDPDFLREHAGGGPIGSRVQVYRETASTNDLVLKLGETGEPEGLVIFAESQTAGRGQFRRPWHSAPGLGLWFSILLRRVLPDPSVLTPYVAVAVTEAVAGSTGFALQIAPPNDLYGAQGKVAGILIEARSGAGSFAVVGIGLNVLQQREDFAPEIRDIASSLAIEMENLPTRQAIAASILSRLNALLPEVGTENPPHLARYRRMVESSPAALQKAKL